MINFTIVIQACNFFIVYKMLRTLLFKPAAEMLFKERSHKQGLRKQIDISRLLIEQHNQVQEHQKYQFHQRTAQVNPNAQNQELFILKDIAPPLKIEELSAHEAEQLQHELSQKIVQKVGHVYE